MDTTGKHTRAMILAAGLGTRFKPWTDQHPKALALVNEKSLLQRNVQWLQEYGIRDVIVNVHHFADQVMHAIKLHNGWGSQVTLSDETNEVLETGGGLKKAGWFFGKDPFVLLNVDVLTDLSLDAMMDQHLANHSLATLAVMERETSRYFLFNEAGNLCGWRNVKTGEEKGPVLQYSADQRHAVVQKAFSGVHVIDPALLPKISRKGKFSMVDVYLDLAANEAIKFFDHTGSKLVDVGMVDSVKVAEELF